MTAQAPETDQWAQTTRRLGWAGLVPFITLPIAQFSSGPEWLSTLLITYGMLILAFLCGALWLRELRSSNPSSARLLTSNLLLLAIWPAILMPPQWACLWLSLGFGTHLMAEPPWRLVDLPVWYRRLRLILSSSAIALLVLAAFPGIGRGL